MKQRIDKSVNTTMSPAQRSKMTILGSDTSLFVTNEMQTIRSSQRHGWQGLFAAHTLEHPHESYHHSFPFFWLSMVLFDTEVHRSMSGANELAILPAHSFCMAEPLTFIDFIIGNETEAVHVFLRPELVQEVAHELFEIDADRVSLQPVFGAKSASLSWLLLSIKEALSEPTNLTQLKIDYISRALCADLLVKYSATPASAITAEQLSGLTSKQARRIDEYIVEHIGDDIQISELASLCAMGRTTFHQRFKTTMHMTPHQYIMRLRVSRAKEMLSTSTMPLAEIGFACGFSDQAHFATLFKRLAGTTPALFRRALA